jgi:hypothetical protein
VRYANAVTGWSAGDYLQRYSLPSQK